MKATRVPSPINLEITQSEAELISFLLNHVKSYDRSRQTEIDDMLAALQSVGIDPERFAQLGYASGTYYIVYDKGVM